MSHPFEVGQSYSNRHGTFVVISLSETTMDVCFSDGRVANLSIAAQKLALHMEQLPPEPVAQATTIARKARAKQPISSIFNMDESLPVVAQVIRRRFRITRTWVTQEEVVDGLLDHPAANRMIDRLLGERNEGSPQGIAAEFCTWFGGRMLDDGPVLVYGAQFERSGVEPHSFKLRPPTEIKS
ncbi:MAG: hypothetical protein R6X18_11400 [Chloroflexota bacterium]